ncbi:uncharacterized protein OCT59_015926 [Rhizophagus irregularis]|uniref:uncharacterized protein n=1 Tax=Rhizophagus irregularis TaxID=588596 RepID=UPI000CBB109A|nr:hypothetical protein OCT59_015926 [Rhizophagus irregularis]GBC30780.1 ATP-dependent DNA helicase PIF1-like [Rhizophagus irregularis DAOM 181602=DAOM 197198]CAB5192862.1 unnamed protein product [Rhizophagus irregularis]
MYSDPKYFVEHGILAPINEYVNSINTIIMNQFPAGKAFEYLSADTVEEADDQKELLYSLTVSGLPPHKLILKLGSPIILLCNLQST